MGLFCLCVVSFGPFLSSFLDAAFVVWNHWGQDGYWESIRTRLFSNAVSALIIVPLIVTWVTNGVRPLRGASRSRYLEACALFLGLLAVSYVVLYELRSGADRLFSFSRCHSCFGRRCDSAPWEQARLFRLSASWRFGAHPTDMDHSPAKQLNKTPFQFRYF